MGVLRHTVKKAAQINTHVNTNPHNHMQRYNWLYALTLGSVKTLSPTARMYDTCKHVHMFEHIHRDTQHSDCVTCWFYVSVSHTHSLGVDSLQSTEVKRRKTETDRDEGKT